MPATTTIAAVQKIIQYDTVLIPDVQPFIDSAIVLVDAIIGTAANDTILELVTRYLAAHLMAVTDPRTATEQVKSIQVSYQHKLSQGLGITHFGATAMLLDTSGKLAAHNQKVLDGIAGFTFLWCGKDNSENVTY